MPHRDPTTGKFVADKEYNDIEVVTFDAEIGVQAADIDGTTGFAGGQTSSFNSVELVDYDEIVDRNEELRLLEVDHRLSVFQNSTATEDGTVRGYVEVSAAPSTQLSPGIVTDNITTSSGPQAVGDADVQDTIDLVGRPLDAVGHAPFVDTTNGAGGGGSAGEDRYHSTVFPAEFGRFHPRDELFCNGLLTQWNINDAGIHLDLVGQHVYGVVAE